MRRHRLLLACTIAACWLVTAGGSAAVAGTVGVQTLDAPVRIVAVDAPGQPDGPGAGGLRTEALADVRGRLISLPAGQTAPLHPGDRVHLTVVPGGGGLAARSVQAVQNGQTPEDDWVTAGGVRAPVTGLHTLTILPVYWTTPDSSTRASLISLATATAAYWSAQSGGRITIRPAVRDWARIADPGSCNPAGLANAALAANGLPLPVSTFDHVVVYFPTRDDCGGWVGLGQINGPLIWDNGLPLTDVTAHEFGHNLGLGHAKTATCTSAGARVTLSPTCTVLDYRDVADVMGAAMDRPNGNLNTALADWLGLATVVTVPAGTRATVDLAPLGQVNGARAVRVRVRDAWLYADYRPAVAPDTRRPAWAGVQLHLLPDGGYPQSQLLDAQPGTPAFSAASLPVGRPWAVPGAGLTLTVTSMSVSGARVTVAPTTSDATTPAPVIASPAPRALVGGSATVSWRLTADAIVRVLVDGAVRTTSVRPARSGSAVVSGLTDGTHVLTAQVVDATGAGAASAAVSVMADATAPATPAGLTMSSDQVLTWRAAADTGSGVAGYLVALDGGAPVRLNAGTSARVRTPSGRHTWWVAAVDRAGNLSPATGLVVVRGVSARTGAATVRVAGAVFGADAPRTLTTARTIGGNRTF